MNQYGKRHKRNAQAVGIIMAVVLVAILIMYGLDFVGLIDMEEINKHIEQSRENNK